MVLSLYIRKELSEFNFFSAAKKVTEGKDGSGLTALVTGTRRLGDGRSTIQDGEQGRASQKVDEALPIQPGLEAHDTQQAASSQADGIPRTYKSSCLRWSLVAIHILLLLAGMTSGLLLGRFYYNEGGSSMWMATLVQSGGFPILLPALFFPRDTSDPTSSASHGISSSVAKLAFVYVGIGLLVAGDNMMYSYGLLYLPVSTFSIVCATQVAFNSVFSYFLNAQRFTHLVLNSVVLLTFAAVLLGIHADPEEAHSADSLPRGKHGLGFVLTLAASATFSLIVSLMQVAFVKVIKSDTFSVVLRMQLCTAASACFAVVMGLFASGEWRALRGEMDGFAKGRASYVMTLVGSAISWQVMYVGIVGLIFLVSSLFSCVIATLAVPIVPVFAAVFFRDRMDGMKVVALLLAMWGFVSYAYQNYLDDSRKVVTRDEEGSNGEP